MYVDEVRKLNAYLKKQLWMDFELCRVDPGMIVLFGFIDELGDTKIKIVFKQPYMISCNLLLTYEGRDDFIVVVEGDEAKQINLRYGVTIGNIIFGIGGTSVGENMFVIAKEIEVYILDVDYSQKG